MVSGQWWAVCVVNARTACWGLNGWEKVEKVHVHCLMPAFDTRIFAMNACGAR